MRLIKTASANEIGFHNFLFVFARAHTGMAERMDSMRCGVVWVSVEIYYITQYNGWTEF